MKTKFILSALSVLGFSGCSDNGGGKLFDEPDMYGVPLVEYKFMGELTDKEGNPIEGIEVKMNQFEDKFYSDSEGKFEVKKETYVDGFNTLTFTDVDGEENGGEFETKQVTSNWKDAETSNGTEIHKLGKIELNNKE